MKNKYLSEAIRIGDKIVSQKKVNENGAYWETLNLNGYNQSTLKKSKSIYSGVGGIVLFLIELYKQSEEEKYLSPILEGVEWIISSSEDNKSNLAFYTGKMGLTYVLSQVYKLTGDEKYLNKAHVLGRECLKSPNVPLGNSDLLNGVAGTLFGLLHLHKYRQDKKLLTIIDHLTEYLIENFHHGRKGLFWNKSKYQIRGLCGFSHGAGGIGHVFLELGSYFNNPAFYWIAEQAFIYENSHLTNGYKNWPDFRKRLYNSNELNHYKTKLLNNDLDCFNNPRFDSTYWCHGGPGIGFSRLLGWQYLNKNQYKQDLSRAIQITENMISSSQEIHDTYTLCHGKCGGAMLFIELYKRLGDNQSLQRARSVADESIQHYEEHGKYISGYANINNTGKEDITLFNGSSGIGYFYLMCTNIVEVPSILAPRVNGNYNLETDFYQNLSIDKKTLKEKVVAKAFPRTVSFLVNNFNDHKDCMSRCINNKSLDIKRSFTSSIKKFSSDNSDIAHQQLNDSLKLEWKKLSISFEKNSALQYVNSEVQRETNNKLLKLSDAKLFDQVLKLNKSVILYKSNWYWPLVEELFKEIKVSKKAEKSYYLFLKTPYKVQEYHITSFARYILTNFIKPRKPNSIIPSVHKKYDILLERSEIDIKDLIAQQIRESISSRILIKN